jgi:hypothetical protein
MPPPKDPAKYKLHIQRLSDSHKGQDLSGVKNPMHGKHHSEETKRKMSLAAMGRKKSLEAVAKRSGKNHWNYIDGSSDLYPPDWTHRLREFIRERDDRICQLCDKTEEQNGKRLCVHHIDYDKENCEPQNLVSLCSECHDKTKFNRECWQKIFEGILACLSKNL